MGLTKSELCKELNEAFDSIYGEWENNISIHLYPNTNFSSKSIANIKDYCNQWLQFVNRHNKWWGCHIEFITNNRGFDRGFMMICSWQELDRVEVEFNMDDESETEL
jgi:hypothetical protein